MCTRNQAEEILHSVYHACSPIFGRIHDAYLYGSYARGDFNPETLSDSAAVLPKRCAGGHSLCRHMNEKRCRRRGWNTQLNAFPRRGTYLKQGIIRVQRTVGLTVIRK